MKTAFITILAMSLSALAACQSSSAPVAAESRTIELGGIQARNSIDVPANDVATAPYALRGMESDQPAMPTGIGYQAR